MSPFIRAAGVYLLLTTLTVAARADEPTWAGKTVLLKRDGITFARQSWEGVIVFEAPLTHISYKVLREEGRWFRVRQGGEEGWLLKEEAVLPEDAVSYFTSQIKAGTDVASAYVRRALARRLGKDWDGAIQDCDAAIRLNSQFADAYRIRADAWSDKKEHDKALKDYAEAIRLDPRDVYAYYNRGLTWSEKKDYNRAIQEFGEAIRLDPTDPDAYRKRRLAWFEKENYDRALEDCDEAIRLDPKCADAYCDRAWLLSGCPEAKYRDGRKAIASATRACELTEWKDARYLGVLAAAYAEDGQFDKAVEWQEKALQDRNYEKATGEIGRCCLQLYHDKKPYHQERPRPR